MKIYSETTVEESRIELIPLIDVIFCILTFFILASLELTRQQAINVDLPKATTSQAQPRNLLIVSLDAFGQIYIEDQPVNANQLEAELTSYVTLNPMQTMVLYAPQEARYHEVVKILDILRKVGGSRVALATLPGSSPNNNAQPAPITPGNLPAPNLPNSNPLLDPGAIPGLQQPPSNLGTPGTIPGLQQPPGNLETPATPGSLDIPGLTSPSPAPAENP